MTNGPAFPFQHQLENGGMMTAQGMELRDYLAAKALQGGIGEFFRSGDAWDNYEDFAESCYAMADAMMKERSKS